MQKSLSFRDSALENDYAFVTQNFHIISFRNFLISIFFQSAALYVSNPLGLNNLELGMLIPFIAFILVIITVFLAVGVKFIKFCSLALSICVLLYNIAASEITNRLKKELSLEPWIYFLLGINLQTGCLFLLMSRIRWTHSLVLISFINVFSWIRIIEVFHNREAQKTALISMIINIFFLCSMTYSNEKGDRSRFQKLKSKNCQPTEFEELLRNAIPTSIIIFEEDKVEFMNESTKHLLGVLENSQVLNMLRKLKVVLREQASKFLGGLQNKFEAKSKNSISLYELIKNCEHSWIKVEPFSGFSFVEAESDEGAISRTFACQVGPTIWKAKKCVLIVLSDITDIRDHYKNMDAYKDNLLATVSHDLRTPLNGMLGMLELMLDEECENDSRREKIVVTINSAKLLLSMINDILDFSLISKGKLRLKFEPTNATFLVEETVRILQMQAKMKGLDLVFNNRLEKKEENHIIDGNRIRQVLLNLIGNAIKFTNIGKISITLEEELVDEAPEFQSQELISLRKIKQPKETMEIPLNGKIKSLLFEVEDTGIGIKSSDQGRLFKLFSRVNVEEGQNKAGIGLGLAISQRLVCMMNSNRPGAKITVTSEYGKGSKFTFPIFIEPEPSILFKEATEFENKTPLNFEAKTFNRFQVKDEYSLSNFSPNRPYVLSSNISPTFNLSPVTNFSNHSLLPSEGDWLLLPARKQTNVLVVDDDQINILVAKSYFNSLSDEYVIYTAFNGKEAVEKVTACAKNKLFFDIILMDCNMPVMDGYEASEILKSMMNDGLIPYSSIVAVTADAGNGVKEKCLSYGMEFFLIKPYSKVQLLTTIKDTIKK